MVSNILCSIPFFCNSGDLIITRQSAIHGAFPAEKKYKRIDLYESVLNFYMWGNKIGIFRDKFFEKPTFLCILLDKSFRVKLLFTII